MSIKLKVSHTLSFNPQYFVKGDAVVVLHKCRKEESYHALVAQVTPEVITLVKIDHSGTNRTGYILTNVKVRADDVAAKYVEISRVLYGRNTTSLLVEDAMTPNLLKDDAIKIYNRMGDLIYTALVKEVKDGELCSTVSGGGSISVSLKCIANGDYTVEILD